MNEKSNKEPASAYAERMRVRPPRSITRIRYVITPFMMPRAEASEANTVEKWPYFGYSLNDWEIV